MKSILIIEDDEAMLRGLTDNFTDQGFEVQTATDGNLALPQARSAAWDVILLDIMLPNVNGYEICRQIRRDGSKVPIIMLTAKGQEEDVIRGLDLGADDYMVKPFSIRELLARVNALLRRNGDNNDDLIQFAGFELDLTAHTLTRGGESIPLTTKEFRLLSFFAQRPFRALTRHEILQRVWGNSVIVTARSVDRCVTTLRSKIELDPSRPQLIQTIRDVGYRFQMPAE